MPASGASSRWLAIVFGGVFGFRDGGFQLRDAGSPGMGGLRAGPAAGAGTGTGRRPGRQSCWSGRGAWTRDRQWSRGAASADRHHAELLTGAAHIHDNCGRRQEETSCPQQARDVSC